MYVDQEIKMMEAAIDADLNARKFVLREKLQKASTVDEFLFLFNRLDAIEHRIECRKIRRSIKSYGPDPWRQKRDAAALEKSYAITHK